MSTKFYTLLTDIGAAKLASAAAIGVPLKITHMAVGDGGGALPTPDAKQTALVNEKRRAALNMLYIDPQNSSQIIAEQVIPENEGGWWIREVGLFDESGALIAVGNCPESYKPQLAEGSGRTQTVRMVLITSSTDNITLKIDPAVVLATRKYVDDKALELKVYVDDLMAKHLAAPDPHSQYAPKESPTFTGTPKAPTPAAGNNTTQLATTAFVQAALTALINGAPATLDTLKEIAAAINNDPNFSTTINNVLALKAPLSSPALTGTPTAPTAAQSVNNTQIATTAFVKSAIAAMVGSAPAALDTLNELAAALGNDPNFATTMLNALAGKQPLDNTLTNLSGKDVAGLLAYLGISAPGGAGSVGYKLNAENTVSRTAYDNFSDRINAGDFGIKGDGIADNAAAITKACAALQKLYEIDGIRRTLVFTDGSYRTSATIVVHANMLIHCEGGVVFQNIGAVKTFAAVELQGGSKKSVLGTMDGYGSAILIRGSTHTVEFQTISNCVDGVIFRADNNWASTKSSLDNVVRGVQIGKCTNAIVFEQNANNLVQQGNEVRVNFVSETPNTLLFRNFDGFVHTEESNWDSNFVELIASDPITLPDSSMARNSTPHSVSNLTMAVKSWCGGWVPDAGSMCLIRGAFSTSTFEFNLAQRVGLNEVVDAVGVNSFGSCILRNTRYENLGNSISYIGVTPGAEFNSGLALFRSKFRVRFTVVPLAAGQTYGLSFKHVLSQRSNTGRVRIVQYSDTARGKLLIEVRDAGTETQGLVRVWFTNLTQTTTSTMDVEIIFEAE
ncbi:phage tail protein [Escherichia coli]|nr:phage tail protein [Escherichia coli]MDY9209977.1 phage tail protein [Escherichia coli]MDY9263065.1 phage tail protein [Escherichia coli]MDY9317829.1 phage tail protein [Escherichia coli]MDY9323871.1 phage tail protein [Escherichia coli]